MVRWRTQFGLVAASMALACFAPSASAEPQTVCTITVNSADEKEAFRRHLPAANYRFVELVEPDRPDWLASACRSGVNCDVLIVSGHYDGSSEFFSDRLEVREHLPVAELERASCSAPCSGLFSRLKEVYLFGCNTLNPRPISSASAEVVRSLVREGHSSKEAERRLRSLGAIHGESSRDRMRQVFSEVPVIYGFSSSAPLGPIAGSTLERHFRAGGAREVARGHPSGRLLGHFAPFSMSVTEGVTDGDRLAAGRRDVCMFADDRRSDSERLDFLHQVLRRPAPVARLYLDRIQRLVATLRPEARSDPRAAAALEAIARDSQARARYLEFARKLEPPSVRSRMLEVARDLGWLSEEELWDEVALLLGDVHARGEVGLTEVDLACTLNQGRDLDGALDTLAPPGAPGDDVAHAAVRACLGSAEGRSRTLVALTGASEADVLIAQAYLRHRPIVDPAEMRRVASDVARMAPSEAQVRALEALGRHYLSDREILEMLVQLFARTPAAPVQAAIAGILIRADRRSIAGSQLVRTLRDHRLPSSAGHAMIDALIHRLELP